MNSKLSLLFFLLSLCGVYAQGSVKITGRVLDKKLNEAIPYATITLKKGDTVITGGMTTDNGTFSITATADTYNLDIQFIGYTPYHKEIALKNATDLGTIYLEAESTTLADVNIVAERSTIDQN